MANISIVGWIVIGIVAVLLFILLKTETIKFKKGDTEIGIGMQEKVQKMDEEATAERKDMSSRMNLHRLIQNIDEKLHADLKRATRNTEESVYGIFTNLKCEYPVVMLVSQLKSELFQRIDENNLRQRLSVDEKKDYLWEIKHNLKNRYESFLAKSKHSICDIQYSEFASIEDQVDKMLEEWAQSCTNYLIKRMNEKILLYKDWESVFITSEYKDNSIYNPIKKNQNYIKDLGGSIDE